jgi:hypothetical protein
MSDTNGLTTDPTDPRLGHGEDKERRPQNEVYLVLSEAERQSGFVRPYRDTYKHTKGEEACQTTTKMNRAISETYAKDPSFYGSTYCVCCGKHLSLKYFQWVEKDGSLGPTVGT